MGGSYSSPWWCRCMQCRCGYHHPRGGAARLCQGAGAARVRQQGQEACSGKHRQKEVMPAVSAWSCRVAVKDVHNGCGVCCCWRAIARGGQILRATANTENCSSSCVTKPYTPLMASMIHGMAHTGCAEPPLLHSRLHAATGYSPNVILLPPCMGSLCTCHHDRALPAFSASFSSTLRL